MKNVISLLLALQALSGAAVKHHYERLNGPVVGILSLPTSRKDQTFSQASFSMIPGSYVKWLEQAGIRIVPIRYDMPKRVIEQMMSLVNGILITGGSTALFREKTARCRFSRILDRKKSCPSPYMRTVHRIVRRATQLQRAGNPFPLWGTCLGFEALLISLSRFTLRRSKVLSTNHSLNLKQNAGSAAFFRHYFGAGLTRSVSQNPIIYFNHKFGFRPRRVQTNKQLGGQVQVLATTKLETGEEIVSMVRHRTLPFIGVQFHPEKIQFEHRASVSTNVSNASIEASHTMAMLFFDLVNQNQNEIENEKELEALLIYNYTLYKSSGPYEQMYVFPKVFELRFQRDFQKVVI